jgi:aryl-alcohol dehydrogenase-like predicted oxidoreductase
MNWIDTAESYGGGRSEQLARIALAGRVDVLVFTKVSPLSWGGTGVGADDVRAALEGSLRRLGAEQVDVYQLHALDPSVPVEETWGAMAALVDDGLARWIGLSNVDQDTVARCHRVHPVIAVQNELSLTARDDTTSLLPWLADGGIGYLGYGPLGYGVLTGSIPRDARFATDDWRGASSGGGLWRRLFAPGALNAWLDRVDRLRPIAERLDAPVSAIALSWAIAQHGVTGVIAGSRHPNHVRANAAARDLELAPDVIAEIDTIFN